MVTSYRNTQGYSINILEQSGHLIDGTFTIESLQKSFPFLALTQHLNCCCHEITFIIDWGHIFKSFVHIQTAFSGIIKSDISIPFIYLDWVLVQSKDEYRDNMHYECGDTLLYQQLEHEIPTSLESELSFPFPKVLAFDHQKRANKKE